MPPRVRKSKKAEPKKESVEEMEVKEEEKEEEEIPKEIPVVKRIPSAMVYVKECACYVKDGKKFYGGSTFMVSGEELIDYYSKDGHFNVVLQ
jgi:hypothetical protein